MCNFLCAIITRDGKIVVDGETGHAALARQEGLKNNGKSKQQFWEWEWNLRDAVANNGLETRNSKEPTNKAFAAAEKLYKHLKTLNGVSDILPWLAIYRTGSHDGHKKTTHIIMYDGTLERMYGGTLEYMNGGTLEHMDGGTLKYMNDGTLKYMDGKIPIFTGSSNIVGYKNISKIKLAAGSNAVLIDRSGDRPKCRAAAK